MVSKKLAILIAIREVRWNVPTYNAWRTLSNVQGVKTGVQGQSSMPVEPGPDECCQNGCQTCVWDLYKEAVDEWRLIHHKDGDEAPNKETSSTGIDAFSDFEARLQRGHETHDR